VKKGTDTHRLFFEGDASSLYAGQFKGPQYLRNVLKVVDEEGNEVPPAAAVVE
jgi:hypothetical protein